MLVGAGHAHVGVLRDFGLKPVPGLRLTLVTRHRHTPYSGMLPGLIAGLYSFEEAHIDAEHLCGFAGAELIEDEAVGLDLSGKRVLCKNGPPVPYDLLSLDIGSTPNTGAVPGAAAHSVPVKPIDGFLLRFDALCERVRAGEVARIGIVGGGAGGVELSLALERRLRRALAKAGRDPRGLTFSLVTRSPELMPAFPRRMRKRFADLLEERGIAVRTGAPVIEVLPEGLRVGDRSALQLDKVLWTTEAAAPSWLRGPGLALDARGFIRVRPTLESVSHRGVFAAGDVASLEGYALPKSGVYAVRQAPVLARNLRRALAGQPLAPYRPQRDALYIVSTGEKHAVATRNGLVIEGDWVWRFKDWLDRRFMRQFSDLPNAVAPHPVTRAADTEPGNAR